MRPYGILCRKQPSTGFYLHLVERDSNSHFWVEGTKMIKLVDEPLGLVHILWLLRTAARPIVLKDIN